MACDPLIDEKGNAFGFLCSRGSRRKRCSVCKTRPATKLCDFPLKGRKQGKTCDADLCNECAVVQPVARLPELFADVRMKADTVDFCPAHDRLAKEAG